MQGNANLNEKFELTGLIQDGEEIFNLKPHMNKILGIGLLGALGRVIANILPKCSSATSQLGKFIIPKFKNLIDLPSVLTELSTSLGMPINGHLTILGLITLGIGHILLVKLEGNEEFKQKFNSLKLPEIITISGGIITLIGPF